MAIKLFVGGLSFSTSTDRLREVFAGVGAVESASVVTDRDTGRSRGFGFVEMADDDARKAIDELTGANMGGRSITVNEARPRAPRENRGGPRRDDRRY
jgi:cold-inducible RNA-binding protein